MPSDYNAIRTDHIRKYGEDTKHLELYGELYSDRTHFVYELLQNAEDAGATRIAFTLHPDRLVVTHNGRPFDEADVRSICALVESTKTHEVAAIGKFGIGFKSVYAVTQHPEVHSGDEHFVIDHYVRPRAVAAPLTDLDPDDTCFLFPFDRVDTSPEDIMESIARGLREQPPYALLFLRSLATLHWSVDGGDARKVTRTERPRKMAREVVLTLDGVEASQTRYLVMERAVDSPVVGPHRVEVAYRIEHDRQIRRDVVAPVETSPVIAFFPTERTTHLGFHIQGPYRTTPARDNIRQNDEWNEQLVRETAVLVVESLRVLKHEGLLDERALATLPIDSHHDSDSVTSHLRTSLTSALQEEALIPTNDGRHVSASTACLARGSSLRDLLSPAQLGRLLGLAAEPSWVSKSITERYPAGLWDYLQDEVGVQEISPETAVNHLTASFLEAQPDGWILALYRFVAAHRALFSSTRSSRAPLVHKPIVRLEDGTHVPVQDQDGSPCCYLPTDGVTSDLPIVRRSIASTSEARELLLALGVTEMDPVAEVLERVLPHYREGIIDLASEEHSHNLRTIEAALESATQSRRELLVERLYETPFLATRNAATDEATLRAPRDSYLRSTELELWFDGNPQAFFVAEDQMTTARLKTAGVRTRMHTTARKPQSDGHVKIRSEHGDHVRGVDGFDPDFAVDGLDWALAHPNAARSEMIWNHVLCAYSDCLQGVVEVSTRQTFDNPDGSIHRSRAAQAASTLCWIPGPAGAWRSPADTSLEDLPKGWTHNRIVAEALGMQTPRVLDFAREIGFETEDIQLLMASPEMRAKVKAFLRSNRDQPHFEIDDDPEVTHDDDAAFRVEPKDATFYVQAVFGRGDGAREHGEPLGPRGPAPDPIRRRHQAQEELRRYISDARRGGRPFKRVPTNVWRKKDSAVRLGLYQEYRGRCQICDDTFPKRNGEPYFEGIALIPFSMASWADRMGNALCLCAGCAARFQHGSVECEDVLAQVAAWKARGEGGDACPIIKIALCGKDVTIQFTERHMIELQELMRAGDT